MNYKVIVSEQAERDLGDIYSYIYCELKSKSSAEKMALRLRGAMTGLSIMPKRYRVYPLEPWLSREVWITRIVYGKRDMKKTL